MSVSRPTSYRPVKHTPRASLYSTLIPVVKSLLTLSVKKNTYKELSLLLPFYPSPAPACLCTGRLLLLVVLSLHLGRVGAPLFISCYTAHTLLMGSWLLPVLVRVEIPPDASKREGGVSSSTRRRKCQFTLACVYVELDPWVSFYTTDTRNQKWMNPKD